MALSIGYISFYAVWELDDSLEDKSAEMSTFFLNEEKLNVCWFMNPHSAFLDLKHSNVPCEVTNAVLHFTMSFRAISAQVLELCFLLANSTFSFFLSGELFFI